MAPVHESPASNEASELLVRRTLRRARVRLPEDPIVAALGLEEEADDTDPAATEPSAVSRTRRGARRG
jgi:hypothetical protein